MASSVLNSASLPAVDVLHCTDNGLRSWRPAFTSLQVCRLHNGTAVLTLQAPGHETLTLDLDHAAREHLIRLLAAPCTGETA